MITALQAYQIASHPFENEISTSIKELLIKWITTDAKCGRHRLCINEISLKNLNKWQKIAIWLESYGYKYNFQENNIKQEYNLIIAW